MDETSTVAFKVHSGTARIDADIVPCFNYRYYFASGNYREGSRVFRKDGTPFENYPAQQLEYGNDKNKRTGTSYKKAVRVVKRIENEMFVGKVHPSVPSYFMKCLVYNCPDSMFAKATWTERIREIIVHIWNGLAGYEPAEPKQRWLEVNECKYLFFAAQKWTRAGGRGFAKAMWNHLGYKVWGA